MAQAVIENALSPRLVDQLFEDTANAVTRDLLFSSVVGLMSWSSAASNLPSTPPTRRTPCPSLSRSRPSTASSHASTTCRGRAGPLDGRTAGPGHHRHAWRPDALPGGLSHEHPRRQPPARQRAPDQGVAHHPGRSLPGHTLVVLDPDLMLVIDAIPCEDGHAQERSLLDQVEATVRPSDLWIADRNFCTTGFVFGVPRRGGRFLIRQHASTLHYTLVGKRKARGRIETGPSSSRRSGPPTTRTRSCS